MNNAGTSGTGRKLLYRLSSVWLGVALLSIILVYASVVSALPQVRGAIEMTEMQVFQHWLFAGLCVLFSLSLALATLVRCRWDALGAGAIIVHVGLLLLVGGAVAYFGRKVEGDVPLFSPRIEVIGLRDGVPRTLGMFLADRGQAWQGLTADGRQPVRIEVVETRTADMNPVGEARLEVQVAAEPAREITLSAAGPNRVQVHDGLAAQLRTFTPTDRFYDQELAALYYRKLSDPQGAQRFVALPELPWHRERYLDEGYAVRDVRGADVPTKRVAPFLTVAGLRVPTGWFEHWRLPIRPRIPELPFEVEVTGYLPYTSETGFDAYGPDGRRLAESELSSVDATKVHLVPRVQPLELRRPGMGRGPSAIRLKFIGRGDLAGWTETQWCPFSQYPHIEAVPIRVRPPNSPDVWELLYSRYERDLGATLAGGKLSVTLFPGRQSAESWRSDFLALVPDAAAPVAAAVYTNQTYNVGEYTLFQSGAASDHWSWTILGVGNRHGIWPMTLGCILITVGTLYAFYVKPLILRRRRAAGRATGEPPPREVNHAPSLATADAQA